MEEERWRILLESILRYRDLEEEKMNAIYSFA